ncbi:hypothetical protein EBR66_00375 [bacterium]|nr:hypothetical protein [bacterium]
MAAAQKDALDTLAEELFGPEYANHPDFLALFDSPARDRGMVRLDLLERKRFREAQIKDVPSSRSESIDV